jgi:Arc/MetJ-type ribon-helix-helix transcriptional regulator
VNIEIHTAALKRRVKVQIQSGRFHDVDELLTKALDALEKESATAPAVPYQRPAGRKSLAELFEDSPWKGLDLDFSRNKADSRPVDLS